MGLLLAVVVKDFQKRDFHLSRSCPILKSSFPECFEEVSPEGSVQHALIVYSLLAAFMLSCATAAHRPPTPLFLLLMLPGLLLAWFSLPISAASDTHALRPIIRILYPAKGEIFSGCNWINFTAVVQVNNVASESNLKVTFHIDDKPISQATGQKDLAKSFGADIIYSFNVEFDIEMANETATYGNLARAVAVVDGAIAAEDEIMFGTHVLASPKKFIYLVQNEHALDLSQLQGPRSDVIQLVFKVPPPQPSADIHWAPNTSWNSGRNVLYELALQRQRAAGLCYMYFIFRDGDCELEEVIDFGHNTGNPYRTFEKYLTMTRPAVGIARYDSFQEYNASKEYQLAYNFDQLFVAVHHDAANLLLPYSTQWDNESWSHPSRIFTMLSAAHYHRHRIQFNALRAVDFKSGTYPAYGGFINPLSWLFPALQTKEQVWSLRYLKEDWGHPRPGQVLRNWQCRKIFLHSPLRSRLSKKENTVMQSMLLTSVILISCPNLLVT
jgi:hypothetical protein